jgi:hypothetical protein
MIDLKTRARLYLVEMNILPKTEDILPKVVEVEVEVEVVEA